MGVAANTLTPSQDCPLVQKVDSVLDQPKTRDPANSGEESPDSQMPSTGWVAQSHHLMFDLFKDLFNEPIFAGPVRNVSTYLATLEAEVVYKASYRLCNAVIGAVSQVACLSLTQEESQNNGRAE